MIGMYTDRNDSAIMIPEIVKEKTGFLPLAILIEPVISMQEPTVQFHIIIMQ